jgi:Cys-tRNA(Pro)/Cys-tRNA(Cys) deacylase
MATRGIQELKDRGVPFEVLTYRYDKMGARIAAEAVEEPEDVVLKSLVFRAEDGSFLFALVSGNANVSTRRLGRVSGHKRVEAASPRDAERVTGYQVGGISPLGARDHLPVFLDMTTAAFPQLILNAGGRGTLVRLGTDDLIRITEATTANIRAG